MSERLGFISNMDRCIGCNACVMACKSYYGLEPDMKRRKVREIKETLVGEPERCYLSGACHHCEHPACMKACPTGAYKKEANGIVTHDREVCIGCKMCLWACPYEAPTFNNVTKKMDKCDLCKDRLEQGLEPICVASCPMQALSFTDMSTVAEGEYSRDVTGYPDSSITDANLRIKLPHSVTQVRR